MKRLEFALREWAHIESSRNSAKIRSSELDFWLSNRVCAAIAELTHRSDFKQMARWPLDRLRPGASTPERQLIEQIDAALVQTATSLASILSRSSVQAAFGPLPSSVVTLSGSETITGDMTPSGAALVQTATSLASILSRSRVPAAFRPQKSSTGTTVEYSTIAEDAEPVRDRLMESLSYIAGRPWLDLVCTRDYFHSTGGMNLVVEPSRQDDSITPKTAVAVQWGHMIPAFEPSLRYGADFVFRCLELRIMHWKSVLTRASTLIMQTIKDSLSAQCQDAQDVRDVRIPVQSLFEELKALYRAERDTPLRDACLVLVQTYASYNPSAELTWLGLDSASRDWAGMVRVAVERDDMRMVEAVVAALQEVQRGLEEVEDVESRILELAKSHTLCIIEGIGRRDLYWQGDKIEADWAKAKSSWSLLVALAEKAAKGLAFDGFDLEVSVKDAKSRLRAHVPVELFEKIMPNGRRTYRLDLAPEQICVRTFEEDEVLKEPT